YNISIIMAPCEGCHGHGGRDESNEGGGHSDALAASVVERACGRYARWAGECDGSGGGGRTVSSRAQHARGGCEVCDIAVCQWLHRLSAPPQCARWRYQRRALGLGRVRNRGRRPPWHRVL